MPRLFIAVDVPSEWISSLRALETDSLQARWTPPDQYHLTLRFLGDVGGAQTQRIAHVLSHVKLPAFELGADGLLMFPSSRRPRVIAANVAGVPGLTRLRGAIDRAVAGTDVGDDPKPFRPHVTVARLKSARPADVRAFVSRHSDFSLLPFTIEDFHLYRSDPGRSGAVHTVVDTFRLET